MSIERYFIDTHGNDDDAYREAVNYASNMANENENISRIVFLVGTKIQTGWLERIYNRDIVKKLFAGLKFSDCRVNFKIETKITFNDFGNKNSVIVISCGLNSDDLYKIDDFECIDTIVAIPWLKERTLDWVRTWGATDLRGGQNTDTLLDASPVVKEAMNRLDKAVNTSSSLTHDSDSNLSKTYILALHKYEPELDAIVVTSYLKKELNWDAKTAEKIEKMINTLNAGKSFQGGERKGLKNFHKQWSEAVKS
ncbi:MAG: hypothetical protein PSV16_00700 [Flavobacterium sp.]|nr:hypothetical protein [Flavobacterium sp.]